MAEAKEASDQGDLLESETAASEVDADSQESSESSSGTTDVAAESSAAEDVKEPKSPLEAVMAALKDKDSDSSSESESVEASDTSEATDDEEETEVVADELDGETEETTSEKAEDKKLPFAEHPRFKQLLAHDRERRQLKDEIEPLKEKVTALEPKAKHYDEIVRFAQQSNFTQDDFSNLLTMGRLMKSDPIAFHKAFKPHWDKIEQQAGERLPDDLQQKVEAGTIDGETAVELARKRAEAEVSNNRASMSARQLQQQSEESQRAETQRKQTDFVNAIGNSVTAWEKTWKTSDPDYAKKQPFVMDRVMRLLQQSPPKSTEDALAMCTKARKEVESALRSTMPAKTAIRTNSSGTSVDAQGEPKSPLEAAELALQRMNG